LRFQYTISCASGPVVRRCINVEELMSWLGCKAKRKRKGPGSLLVHNLLQGTPSMAQRVAIRSHFLKVSPLPNTVSLETKPPTHGPSRDI
jgi:hypothetical protein